ncbi:hypothetical protein DA075_35455 (plasmid) [Methylobacterium currus]|uniref:Uncharacterized protein n=1 Tax=Methylobacterium currus TaxID=2051553 RepID=A0A2R4WXC5_9HYPH|nr:hypothetical protein [Methylobacterium currus]AWB26170.1 hypothetical protein DA075_35455 [Methylobacterium currus]
MSARDETALRVEAERTGDGEGPWIWAIYQGAGEAAPLLKRSDVTYPSPDAAKRVGDKVRAGMLSAVPASDEDGG